MNSTKTVNPILHRSSHRILKAVLSIASNRVSSDKFALAPSSRGGLKPNCLVGKIFELKPPFRIPKEKALLRCVQPRNTDSPNVSSTFSTGNLSNFRYSNMRTA